jgi:glycine/D-amino acid oxidase-like deaminating enzyme
LGPITGKIIANTILAGSPNVGIDLAEFLPDRFADVDQEAFYISSQNVDE